MSRFEKYVGDIISSLDYDKSEKEDLKTEFIDHLNLLKAEYVTKGYNDEDSEKLAMADFGNAGHLNCELRKTENKLRKVFRAVIKIAFGLYVLTFVILLLSPFRSGSLLMYIIYGDPVPPYRMLNIVPFHTISNYIKDYSHYNPDVLFSNLVGNILIFIPLGFLLPLIIKKKIKLLGILIICVITSFAIEILQGVTYIGVADIDDVLLYVLGAVIGYMIYIGVKKLIVLTLKEISIKNKRTS